MPRILGLNYTDVPIGSVQSLGTSVIPTGWLLCDGTAVSRATYPQLYAAVGNAFGPGDGSTTFALPDFRGRTLRGVAGGSGLDPDVGSRNAQNLGGNAGNAVGSQQADAFQGHWHHVGQDTQPGAVPSSTRTSAGPSGGADGPAADGNGGHGLMNRALNPITGQNGIINVTSETRMKNAYVQFIIKYA